jgi:uncharacterized membrane protein YraQ (UPF0718 family)
VGVWSTIGGGIEDALLMAWEVWWALVLGFAISAIVQAWVPRARIQRALAGSGGAPVARATGLGAASSSCSYAAVAIAKSLFQKGASAASALAFQFASTNLVWELGLVLWVLLGWQFTLAEYVGGVVMIALMTVMLRAFVSPRLEREARAHAQRSETEHCHEHHQHAASDEGVEGRTSGIVTANAGRGVESAAGGEGHRADGELSWRGRVGSLAAWGEVARNFRADWAMLYKEIAVGFLLAGFVAQLPEDFFNRLFLTHTGGVLAAIENVVVGPLIAVLSFVCSVGNIPLAAVLWSGGISFAGVLSFIFADLIILPLIAIYRKYYGVPFTVRIVGLMFVTMVLAALIVAGAFDAAGLVPTGPRPSRGDVFGTVGVDYKLFLNVLGATVFVALFGIARRPVAPEAACA